MTDACKLKVSRACIPTRERGKGLRIIGAGDSVAGQFVGEQMGKVVRFSYEHYPEETLTTLEALETVSEVTGEAVEVLFTWVDDNTGQVISKEWKDLDQDTRDQLKGGATVFVMTVPYGALVKAGHRLQTAGRQTISKVIAAQQALRKIDGVITKPTPDMLANPEHIDWARYVPESDALDGAIPHKTPERLADLEPPEDSGRDFIYNNPSRHNDDLEVQEGLPWSKIDFNDLESFGRMSFEDLEHIFKRNGYSIEKSIKAQSSGKAQAFSITSNNGAPLKAGEPKLIQIHPGGGRHESSYHKIEFKGDDKTGRKGTVSYIFNKNGDESGRVFDPAGRNNASTSYYHIDGKEIEYVDNIWRYKL